MSYRETRKILEISRIYQHGKTQVPSVIRKLLQLKDGDSLVWSLENGKIIVEKS